jgi:uracil-DNA glycosylase
MIRHADTSPTARPYLPARISLPTMREAVQGCRGCDLYKHATQAVFGEGRKQSMIMFVGEQPGDQEDKQGRPFVGPAGRMLDRALEEAGIERSDVYVTNAVKHFKYTTRGKRRLHGKPSAREVNACRPWLEGELEVVRPEMLVALGATAVQTLFGSSVKVMRDRGAPFEREDLAPWCMVTIHPSALLRAPDEAARRQAWQEFLRDIKVVAKEYRKRAATHSPGLARGARRETVSVAANTAPTRRKRRAI